MSDEIISIECPLCNTTHKYKLSVQRSTYLFGTTENVRKIKRLFTCPEKNEIFESVLEMKEDDRGQIIKVNIVGVQMESGNDKQKSA